MVKNTPGCAKRVNSRCPFVDFLHTQLFIFYKKLIFATLLTGIHYIEFGITLDLFERKTFSFFKGGFKRIT